MKSIGRVVGVTVLSLALWIASIAHPSAVRGTVAAPTPAIAPRAVVSQYCATCHSARAHLGGLVLEGQDPAQAAQAPELWEKVVRKLRAGVMPPMGQPRPDAATYDALAGGIEAALDRAGAATINPGRVDTFHRLNRAEYHNAVRDLLSIDIDVASLLPTDDASYGFDNMAGVLKLNQSVLQRYLAAAGKISRAAINPLSTPVAETFKINPERSQNDRQDGLPFGTRGGALFRYAFPQDGEYKIKVLMLCTTETDVSCDGAQGFSEPHTLEISIDGERVKLFALDPQQRDYRAADVGVTGTYGYEVRLPVKAGPRDIAVTFIKTIASVDYVRNGYRMRFERPYRFNADVMSVAEPMIENVVVTGPFDAAGPGDTPSRRRVLACHPSAAISDEACARTILTSLARRAYRRPPTEGEVKQLLAFYDDGRVEGGFESGIEMALRRMLASVNFLFRVELDPAGVAPGAVYQISDLDLASRLSFFLWSSIPDDELLDAATHGRLHEPAVLEREVRRMLADKRSIALAENFAGQWLRLRNLEAVRPDEAVFPDFDEALRGALRRETELFFDSLVREDRGVLELLTANYTFLNGRLARHYGIPNVQGNEFQRVVLDDDHRRGLLGQGSILTVTSPAIRTSPVQRGKWILENILGSPPPPPPPNVPALSEDAAGSRKAPPTIRERMAQHRGNPVCAGCHSVIDPVGFALENFNWVGQWRDVDPSFTPIDASGQLPDGTKFARLSEFRAALVGNPGRFVNVVIEKLMTYALGRGIEYYDMPSIRKIRRDAELKDYRFRSVIVGIVSSPQFQMRRSAS
jgi:mono/diheme cytochrome c family protein